MARALKILALLSLIVTVAFAGSEEMRTFELYSGANAADSSARTSYRISVRGARKIYLWIHSAGATTDTNYCDSLSTLTALFGDSVSFYVRDSSGTLVTYRNYPGNAGGSGSKVFPICADSISLSTTGASDTVRWVGLNHYATTRPLRTGVVAQLWPAKSIDQASSAGVLLPLRVPDPVGTVQPAFMWLRLTPTTRLTTAGFSSTAGLRTTGVNGLRVTATVVYGNK